MPPRRWQGRCGEEFFKVSGDFSTPWYTHVQMRHDADARARRTVDGTRTAPTPKWHPDCTMPPPGSGVGMRVWCGGVVATGVARRWGGVVADAAKGAIVPGSVISG